MIAVFLALSLFAPPSYPPAAAAAPALAVLQPTPAPADDVLSTLAAARAAVEAARAACLKRIVGDFELLKKYDVALGNTTPVPPLPVPPGPGPAPPTPDPPHPMPNPQPALSERAQKVRDLALEKVPASAERPVVAARVAAAYTSATGADPQALVNNAGAAGIAALGTSGATWRPFFQALVAEMGRWDLSTVDLTRAALADVAAGLNALGATQQRGR